jgi:hypothetical protein
LNKNDEKFIKTDKRVPFGQQIRIGEGSKHLTDYDFSNRRGQTMPAGNEKKNIVGLGIQSYRQQKNL